jgi:6-phosphogluconolactonase
LGLEDIELNVFSSLSDLASTACDLFINNFNAEVKTTLVLPGGSTPKLFFEQLAKKAIDWSNISLIPSDERLVEETSPQSNSGMIKKKLIDRIQGARKPYLFPILDGVDPKEPDTIVASINRRVKNFLPIKAAFLGVGVDGHTASLFSGDKELFSTYKPFLLKERALESFCRVSISASILINTPQLIFLVSGGSKKNVMQMIMSDSKEDQKFPVIKLMKKAQGHVTVLCDNAAAPV